MKSLQMMRRAGLALLLIATLAPLKAQEIRRQLISIRLENKNEFKRLADLNLDLATSRIDSTAEVVATDLEIALIESRGFQTRVLPSDPPGTLVTQYRSYEDLIAYCQLLVQTYPNILIMDTLGYSQVWHLWMPVLKLSDNPEIEEDEAAVLYDGLHHAREPVGMESVLYILEHLLKNYGTDEQVTRWVDEFEIWFIPMVNPEGYKYMIDNAMTSPWWRKNLRDNDADGQFNPDIDGVDLNRNYGYNWDGSNNGDPASWTYRGPEAFSESETRAKRDLALQQKFLLSNTYHSYGEIVIYTWSDMDPAPDQDLIIEIAGEVASRIPKLSGTGGYDFGPSSGLTGFSKNWMYAVAGTIEFTVETATRFIPTLNQGMSVAQQNLQGGLYLLERSEGPGITGHIRDAVTGLPVVAEVHLMGVDNELITPRTSDSAYGRFWRLLQSGTHSLRVSAEGYEAQSLLNVTVNDSTWTEIEVLLQPLDTGFEKDVVLAATEAPALRIYPNPARETVHIGFELDHPADITLKITDLLGREAATLHSGKINAGKHDFAWIPVAGGTFFVVLEADGSRSVGMVQAW